MGLSAALSCAGNEEELNSVSLPFYARDFAASSINEALHHANDILQLNGVTFAIWRNGLACHSDEFQLGNAYLVRQFMAESELCVGAPAIQRYKDSFARKQAGALDDVSEIFAQISFARSGAGEDLKLYPSFTGGVIAAYESLERYRPLSFDVVAQAGYRLHTSWLGFEMGYSLFQDIHIDGDFEKNAADRALPFSGSTVRLIANLSGSATTFYGDEGGRDALLLPSGSIGIFKPFNQDNGYSWHSAGASDGCPRVVSIADISCLSLK